MWIKKYSRVGNIQYDELARAKGMIFNLYFPQIVKSVIVMPAGSGFTDGYYQDFEWSQLMKKIAKNICDKNFHSQHESLYKQKAKKYLKSTLYFQKNLTKLSNQELLKYYQNFVKSIKNYWLFFYTPWAIDEVIEPLFEKKLKKIFRQKLFILEAISNPTQEIRYNKQLKILLKLKLNHQLTKKNLKNHAKKWGYLNLYAPQDEPFRTVDFFQMVKNVDAKTKLQELENEITRNRQDYKKALNLLKKEKKLFELAKLINLYVYLRTERIDVFREATALIKPFYQELDRRLGLKKFQSSFMTIEEIVKFLKSRIKPDLAEIKERAKIDYCFYHLNGKSRIILDKKEIEKIHNQKLKIYKKEVNQFFGTVAQKGGIIKSKVKIIMSANDGKKFKQNEILVSSMTRPEYITIIKRAKAIITDEGGITCHAAIISRELKIPCVVGTKIATQVLRDGQIVEVDATKGIVRIVEK